ncbi:beta-1 4-xylanase-like protein [Planomonospora sphaerica]|uniref:Beta-xylanase n=1 Tax=Planomonospora sphaerica TaxID=161355 RepID=A0A171C8L4_9ACTN|nr:endo-1,4-beta-xylanase [Planomonospora sphaerica]GAT66289.1 beta-1 4-xylanase-like protein [Planomonospora sphaerica]
MPALSRLRRAVLTGALAVLPAAAVVALPAAPAQASSPLRVHAEAQGKFIGTALATSPLANETAYRNIAATEFNQITAENAMKWDATESSPNQFNFSGADQIMAFAEQNGQQVHGHTLVWHNQTPNWVQSLSATEMRSAMQNHISRVAGRYASNPVLKSWDVVNEVFEENGSLRNSFWYQRLGESYIADAFRYAKAADPDAKLCINDYNVEGVNAKSTAMYNLVRTLRAQNVPVDCVGFQSHLAIQYGFPNIQENMQRFADLGVEVRVTEIDVRMQMPRSSAKDATQATYYSNVVKACLAVSRCSGVTIWGFTDKHSWVPDTFSGEGAALIYDENYAKKASYTAVHDALAAGDPGDPDDTEDPSRPGTPAASAITSSGATLTWTASTDNVRVTGYDVYRGTTKLASTTTNSATLTGLTPETAYTVHVVARDAAGNTSAASETTTFTTLEGPGTGTGCTAAYRTVNSWQGGFQGEVKITCAEPVTSWRTTLTFPSTVTISQNWSSVRSGSGGAYTFTNAAWNGTIGAGGSTTFGFIGSWNGSGTPPTPVIS